MNNDFLENDTKRGGLISTMVRKLTSIEEWIRKHNSFNHYILMPSPEIIGGDALYERFCVLQAYTTTNANGVLMFSSRKRTIPTITFSAAGTFAVTGAAATVIQVATITAGNISHSRCEIDISVAGGLVAGNASLLLAYNTLTAAITITG